MKETLRVGLWHEERLRVAPANTITFRTQEQAGTDSTSQSEITVFSTPQMVALMEKTSRLLLQPYLDNDEASVGSRVDVRHLAATPLGAQVRCVSRLEKIDGRAMTFHVECYELAGGEKIGECHHERFVINIHKFAQRLDAKQAANPRQNQTPVEDVRSLTRSIVEKLRPELEKIEREDRWLPGGPGGWMPLLRGTLPAPFGEARPFADYATQMEELARASGTLAMSFHLNRLMAEMLLQEGTVQQQERHIPAIARGNAWWTFCLSEPQAGSDAAAIATTARNQGGGWILNGTKSWIGLGMHATHFIVLAVTDATVKPAQRMSAFIVERNARGLKFQKQPMLGYRGYSIAEMTLDNCFVPRDALLGQVGNGFPAALQMLDAARISVAALATGFIAEALHQSLHYTRARQAFGQALSEQPTVQAALADMSCDLEAARLLTHQAAYLKEQGFSYNGAAARAKLFATTAAMKHTTMALQLHGAAGYSTGSTVERLFREAKGAQIFDGASEVQRLVIARNLLQGN
ncbi:MAG: acyl-CoA dehydrogenase family protein [Abitibacteriaceae bacterium]|nr:acyl-CoA dehydrogenase family protein [Abditibacteriaceae bacterium]